MLIPNQFFEIHITAQNRKYYLEKGYEEALNNKNITVKAEDLIKSSRIKVRLICDFCGREYLKIWRDIFKHNSNSHCCRHCVGIKSNQTQKENNNSRRDWYTRAQSFCESKGYILLSRPEDLMVANSPVVFECPEHGRMETKAKMLAYEHGCLSCAKDHKKSKYRDYSGTLKNELAGYGLTVLNPEEYQGWDCRNLKIVCPECGNIFTASFSYLRRAYRDSDPIKCPKCSTSKSKGEERIAEFLNENKIPFIQEKTFIGCSDKNKLRFDFYLPDHNLVIEYMGKQHYYPTTYFGGLDAFKVRTQHDEFKKNFCSKRGINYLDIPYTQQKNIENILSKVITT